MSGTPLMACSRITSTESTRTLALAPGKATVTTTLGGATEGNWEIGRVLIDNPPRNKMMIEMTIANAGLWRIFENIVFRGFRWFPYLQFREEVAILRGISGWQQPLPADDSRIPRLWRRRESLGSLRERSCPPRPPP